jgi:hypothetical protein
MTRAENVLAKKSVKGMVRGRAGRCLMGGMGWLEKNAYPVALLVALRFYFGCSVVRVRALGGLY